MLLALVVSMKYLIFFTSLFLSVHVASANEIVAITEAIHIEDTGIASASMCHENGECSAWRTFYLVEAKAKRIIKGLEMDENITFLFSAHAPNIEDLIIYKNSLVKLAEIKDRAEEIKNIPAKYMMMDWAVPKVKECFENEFSTKNNFDGSMHVGGQKVICFEEVTLNSFLNEK